MGVSEVGSYLEGSSTAQFESLNHLSVSQRHQQPKQDGEGADPAGGEQPKGPSRTGSALGVDDARSPRTADIRLLSATIPVSRRSSGIAQEIEKSNPRINAPEQTRDGSASAASSGRSSSHAPATQAAGLRATHPSAGPGAHRFASPAVEDPQQSANQSAAVRASRVSSPPPAQGTEPTQARSLQSTPASRYSSPAVHDTESTQARSLQSALASRHAPVQDIEATQARSLQSTPASRFSSPPAVQDTEATQARSLQSTPANRFSPVVQDIDATQARSLQSTPASRFSSPPAVQDTEATQARSLQSTPANRFSPVVQDIDATQARSLQSTPANRFSPVVQDIDATQARSLQSTPASRFSSPPAAHGTEATQPRSAHRSATVGNGRSVAPAASGADKPPSQPPPAAAARPKPGGHPPRRLPKAGSTRYISPVPLADAAPQVGGSGGAGGVARASKAGQGGFRFPGGAAGREGSTPTTSGSPRAKGIRRGSAAKHHSPAPFPAVRQPPDGGRRLVDGSAGGDAWLHARGGQSAVRRAAPFPPCYQPPSPARDADGSAGGDAWSHARGSQSAARRAAPFSPTHQPPSPSRDVDGSAGGDAWSHARGGQSAARSATADGGPPRGNGAQPGASGDRPPGTWLGVLGAWAGGGAGVDGRRGGGGGSAAGKAAAQGDALARLVRQHASNARLVSFSRRVAEADAACAAFRAAHPHGTTSLLFSPACPPQQQQCTVHSRACGGLRGCPSQVPPSHPQRVSLSATPQCTVHSRPQACASGLGSGLRGSPPQVSPSRVPLSATPHCTVHSRPQASPACGALGSGLRGSSPQVSPSRSPSDPQRCAQQLASRVSLSATPQLLVHSRPLDLSAACGGSRADSRSQTASPAPPRGLALRDVASRSRPVAGEPAPRELSPGQLHPLNLLQPLRRPPAALLLLVGGAQPPAHASPAAAAGRRAPGKPRDLSVVPEALRDSLVRGLHKLTLYEVALGLVVPVEYERELPHDAVFDSAADVFHVDSDRLLPRYDCYVEAVCPDEKNEANAGGPTGDYEVEELRELCMRAGGVLEELDAMQRAVEARVDDVCEGLLATRAMFNDQAFGIERREQAVADELDAATAATRTGLLDRSVLTASVQMPQVHMRPALPASHPTAVAVAEIRRAQLGSITSLS
ncbi:hypothetical protein DIPPA_26421 [Diplonema papillatum]|nr:hypothetical protein DIPPA_26421 [Diplonema papillatum]